MLLSRRRNLNSHNMEWTFHVGKGCMGMGMDIFTQNAIKYLVITD